MSIRRFNRKIRSLAEKGRPGAMLRRVSIRIDADGKRRHFHPTKGWRRLA